ncbi:uncharacterized protein [Medicago truncatula]|uniref:uncharacterized protein n=1 Tax=Medicago truncatula TaxID=3880 RepID=UPI000D2F2DA4|nr:uncharacterized protein LOC112419798 [Medicago truncatula]
MVQMTDNFTAMLFDLLDRLPEQQRLTTVMTLWSLWKSRNLKLWESTDTTAVAIVSRACDVHREWSCMQKVKFTQPNSDINFSWTKPLNGTIKCNVDAAVFNNNSMVGYGMCFRDSLGQLLLEKSDYMQNSATILKVETIGLLEAMEMAISNGMHNVIFETDSRSMENALYSTTTPLNEFGDLL